MSHFCANTVSVDRASRTFRVKGGDNNVVPRSNVWTNPIPLAEMPYMVCSGIIEFTTRSDKALWLEAIAKECEGKLKALTGLSAYNVGNLPDDTSAVRQVWERSVAELAWDADECRKLLRVTADPAMLQQIEAIKLEFVATVLAGPAKESRVLRHGSMWVSRIMPRRLRLTGRRDEAKRVSTYLAQELAQRFSDVVIEPA